MQAEIERLRTLLERQPSCLMRIGVGGTFLAVNDAALNFLGARTLGEVLDTSVVERLDGTDPVGAWTEFARRVATAGSGSFDCEMRNLGGLRRAVVMQAVTLPDHPDGDDSFLVTIRDVSATRRLQASLQEQDELRRSPQEAAGPIHDLRSRLAEITLERDRLRLAFDAATAERQRLIGVVRQLRFALNTALEATLLAQQAIEKGAQK